MTLMLQRFTFQPRQGTLSDLPQASQKRLADLGALLKEEAQNDTESARDRAGGTWGFSNPWGHFWVAPKSSIYDHL